MLSVNANKRGCKREQARLQAQAREAADANKKNIKRKQDRLRMQTKKTANAS